MSGNSAPRANFNSDVLQYALPQQVGGDQVNDRILQNPYHNGVYAADGTWYPAPPMLLQTAGLHHGPPRDQESGLAIAMITNGPVGSHYAFQHPSLPVTIPSVFADPSSALLGPEPRSDTRYIVTQSESLSTSAPVMGTGGWISQSVIPMSALEPIPPVARTLKKPRQQFSACTACRTRRVKCDLKDIRLEWEKIHNGGDIERTPTLETAGDPQPGSNASDGKKKKAKPTMTEKPNLAIITKMEDVQCTNCYNRETTCIDEFAHRKRNKGKRPILEGISSRRSQEVFEEGSLESQYTYSVNPDLPQLANGQLTMEVSAHQEDRVDHMVPPGLPRTWSGISEPADAYNSQGVMHDLGNQPDALEVQLTSQDGKPVADMALGSSVSSQQKLSTFDPQQSSNVTSPEATEYRSREFMLASDHRHFHSYTASAAPSTPRSISSRGPSQETTQNSQISLREFRIPDLKYSFFESDFYRRFHIQRPLIDAIDFANRYKSAYPHLAVNMGPAGAILCHVMYAWACSYGIDESGQPFARPHEWYIPEEAVYPDRPQQSSIRESARQRQLEQTNLAVRQVLKEIDQAGVLRSISWDGARCLLLILPLTEYISSASERLAMYECALGQVFSLCSASALGYDGLPAMPSLDQELTRRRLYWYAFVHEGITTGLKGGRMILDEDDLSSLDDVLPQTARLALMSTRTYQSVAKFASAPIRLAMACRLVHKTLTGAKARRSERVNRQLLNDAWEALEESWIEFESIKTFSPGPLTQRDDVVRFADGWKIFMFEAHNVIRESLEHRARILTQNRHNARLMDLSIGEKQPDARDQNILEIQHLCSIARAKCDHILREIVVIVRQHVNTNFFEWDASLVRDGTYYAAMLLAETNGSESDISCCLEALSEMRWAFARAHERSKELHQAWSLRQNTSQSISVHGQTTVGNVSAAGRPGQTLNGMNTGPLSLYSLEPGVPNIGSINSAESDLLAGAMEDQHHMQQHIDGQQNIQTQTQTPQPQYQQPQYFAPNIVPSTNPNLTAPRAGDGTRTAAHHSGVNTYEQTSTNQRPEQTDKLTGWTQQPVQYDPNQIATAIVYPWPPSYQ